MHTWFWWTNLRERDHLQDSGVDGRIILKLTFGKSGGDMERIALTQNRDRCWTVVNVVMNRGVIIDVKGIMVA